MNIYCSVNILRHATVLNVRPSLSWDVTRRRLVFD